MPFSTLSVSKKVLKLTKFSGTEHSGVDDLILDISQETYVNGVAVNATKACFNIFYTVEFSVDAQNMEYT